MHRPSRWARPPSPAVRPSRTERDLGEVSLPPLTDPTAEHLARVTQMLSLRPELWHTKIGFDPDSRYYARLGRTDTYEVWLLTWLPGQTTQWHDHGSSAAGFTVVSGILRERTVVRERGRGRELERVAQRHLPSGAVRAIAPWTVHDVLASTTPAVSIHAYGPALTSMTRHDVENPGQVWAAPVRRGRVRGDGTGP